MKKIITILLLSFSLQISAQCWQSFSKSITHGAGIKSDGTLWTWGQNSSGQLGNGTTTNSLSPIQVGTDTNWVMVETLSTTTIALKSDGTLWSWGSNSNGQLGTGLPSSTGVTALTPTQVGSDTTWQSISGGFTHIKALKSNGTLWAWGNRIGNGLSVNSNSNVPIQIGTSTWSKIAAGLNHTLAIKTDGTLWAWGKNTYGQLGNNSTSDASSPVQIGTFNDWQSISGGGTHSMGLRSGMGIYLWGNNGYGQLTISTIGNNILVPTLEYNTATWLSISAGNGHSAAIKSDNTLWTWGSNSNGQLGFPSANPGAQGQVGTSLWQKVSAGDLMNFGLQSDGSLWSWGLQGTTGVLGLGTTTAEYSSPQSIICPNLAINDFTNTTDVKLYPNPVKDIINLSFDTTPKEVSIFNLLGQVVITKKVNANQEMIDVSNLTTGTYFLKVYGDFSTKTFKVIKN